MVHSPGTARTPTRFYILSGDSVGVEHNFTSIPQFMYLDLAVSWPATQPVWHQLAKGPQQYIFPAVTSADGQTLIAFRFSPTFAMRYNIASNTWSPSQINPDHASLQGIGAVTDPDTGLVYMAGGFTGNRDTMSVYDFKSDTITTAFQLPVDILKSRAYYANVWVKSRKSIMYFGGYNAALNRIATDNVLTEFDPNTNTLSTVATIGPPPPMRSDHCMASNDDGTLIVVYGGRIQGLIFANDIYVYNVVTGAWKAGPPGLFRVYVACTIVGNQLLVWGGQDEKQKLVGLNALIFDIDAMTWTDHYTAPKSFAGLPQPSDGPINPSGTDSSDRSGKSSLGLIVGVSIGGLVFIVAAVLVGYFVQRRRKHPHGASLLNTRGDDDDPDRNRGVTYPDETTRNDEELQQLRVQLHTQQEELELHRRLMELQQEQQQIQQQRQQQQASQYRQQTQPYQAASIYTAPAAGGHDPFRNVTTEYPQDSKNIPNVGSSTMTSAANLYYSQQHQHQQAPMIPPNSPPIYAAHPYQPYVLVPSPTPSHTFISTSVNANSGTNSTVPSRVNSISALSYNHGEGSSSSSSNEPRGYKSGAQSNPQFGARER
ncbi:hypothetical protein KI688_005298 [Linnemannia hyalina]|uniref:Galactose oxidase n=1 Tax=Linnemannia hyalina TaxID=64524 RepID=A0A9P7XLP3_9FUNG|nr:hypothetical protein KI688_005298 [Linnemannia hyalina]